LNWRLETCRLIRVLQAHASARTRAELDWKPEQPGLIADIDHPAYFAQ
jgi:hypothetical protein